MGSRTPAHPTDILRVAVLISSAKGKNSLQGNQVAPSHSKRVPQPGSKLQDVNGEAQVRGQLRQGSTNPMVTHGHLPTHFPRALQGRVLAL